MGAFSLFIPDRSHLADYSAKTCHLVGFDNVPWQCEQSLDDDVLIVTRQESESGVLLIPWVVDDAVVSLSTGTLAERVAPYLLSVELARGTINRIRNQLALWESVGFQPTDAALKFVSSGLDQLADSVTCQTDAAYAIEQTTSAISLGTRAIERITIDYVEFHKQSNPKRASFWYGFELDIDNKSMPASRSNVAAIPMTWNQVEINQDHFDWDRFDEAMTWCKNEGLCVMSGQFFDLHREAIPDWLYLWQDQTHSIESLLRRFVTQAVGRYANRVHLWHCHAGTIGRSKLGLNEEDQLRLTVAVIESVRQVDKNTPLLITIEQPFGEYLVRDDLDLSPIQFADMLARAGIGVTGFNLRLNFGCDLSHTLFRDAFEIGRLIDMWSLLGKPLVVQLGITSWQEVGTTVESIQRMVDLIATKPAVQGILFDQSLQAMVEQ